MAIYIIMDDEEENVVQKKNTIQQHQGIRKRNIAVDVEDNGGMRRAKLTSDFSCQV